MAVHLSCRSTTEASSSSSSNSSPPVSPVRRSPRLVPPQETQSSPPTSKQGNPRKRPRASEIASPTSPTHRTQKCAHPSPTPAPTSTPRAVRAEKRRKLLPQPTTPTPLPSPPTTRMTRASKRKSLGGDEELQLEVEQPMTVTTRKKKMRKDELDECLEVCFMFSLVFTAYLRCFSRVKGRASIKEKQKRGRSRCLPQLRSQLLEERAESQRRLWRWPATLHHHHRPLLLLLPVPLPLPLQLPLKLLLTTPLQHPYQLPPHLLPIHSSNNPQRTSNPHSHPPPQHELA